MNVGKREAYLRTLLGAVLIIAAPLSVWWMIVPGLVLIATASLSYCPVCHILNVGAEASREDFYLSHLPRYNLDPTCIVHRNGEFGFRNDSFLAAFPGAERLGDLDADETPELVGFVRSERLHRYRIESGGRVFQVTLQGVQEIDGVVGFFADITDAVRMDLEIIRTQREIVYKLGEVSESRSKETGNHVRRVAAYSRLLALASGLSNEEADLVQMASPMHDIGKIGIPDTILNKPGKLTPEEFRVMKTHAQLGYDMLAHSDRPILRAAAIIAGEHHEKWDGSGYPKGTAGEGIHLYGRITAVADVFDALGSDRVYKKAWPLEKILDLFREERGRHFDPGLVDVLLTQLDEFLEIRDQF
jgi:putative two-component system response regulator